MKTIYLVRHGKAAGGDTGVSDFKRALIKKGETNSSQVAGLLKERIIQPTLIIVSPAERAYQTAKIFAKKFGYKQKKIKTVKAIYDQTVDKFIHIIQKIDDRYASVMLVGHNPSLNEFAHFLMEDFNEDIPTSGVVGIECNVESWKDITQGQGTLTSFDVPEKVEKPQTKKSLRKELEKKLAEQINIVLNELDAGAGKKIKKPVRKSSKDISKKFIKKCRSYNILSTNNNKTDTPVE
ncbi:MAG TPA: histidine phosphatase family protein [Anaerolineae bacterium]|nr:histidine phosphatase family protein [Anaerolineae bacterium]